MNMWSWAAWPQWTVLVLILIRIVSTCIRAVKDGEMSSDRSMAAILIAIGFAIGYGAVLHAGGFW